MLKADGSLWMAGQHSFGALGNGGTTSPDSFVQGLEGGASISAGNHHMAAVKTDGSLWMWGSNTDGQLGNGGGGNAENRFGPIQTTPVKVLDGGRLADLRPGCLVIDLASKPGGVDMDAAAQLGVKVIWALSLPGKVAPVTSGKIIRDTIYNILNELGV